MVKYNISNHFFLNCAINSAIDYSSYELQHINNNNKQGRYEIKGLNLSVAYTEEKKQQIVSYAKLIKHTDSSYTTIMENIKRANPTKTINENQPIKQTTLAFVKNDKDDKNQSKKKSKQDIKKITEDNIEAVTNLYTIQNENNKEELLLRDECENDQSAQKQSVMKLLQNPNVNIQEIDENNNKGMLTAASLVGLSVAGIFLLSSNGNDEGAAEQAMEQGGPEQGASEQAKTKEATEPEMGENESGESICIIDEEQEEPIEEGAAEQAIEESTESSDNS